MDNLVRSIKFPFSFNVQRLQFDLDAITNVNWIDHYNKNDYSGKWTTIALMSQTGKSDAVFALPITDKKIVDTELLDSCNYIKEILDNLLFEKTAVRLLRLAAGAEVKPHSDHCLGYEDGCFRLHIPIVTNSDVEFILDEKRLIMNEGECWYIDANFTHSVVNKGTKDRIHLVIDGIRNEWTDKLFYNEAAQELFLKPETTLNDVEKQLIIAELERMNSPVARKIINNLGS